MIPCRYPICLRAEKERIGTYALGYVEVRSTESEEHRPWLLQSEASYCGIICAIFDFAQIAYRTHQTEGQN